jgi:hypothetical protein
MSDTEDEAAAGNKQTEGEQEINEEQTEDEGEGETEGEEGEKEQGEGGEGGAAGGEDTGGKQSDGRRMTMKDVIDSQQQSQRRNSNEGHVAFHMADDGDTRTVRQRIADELCKSITATMVVLLLIFLTIALDQTGQSNAAFSMFVSLFFIVEISIRYYAKGFSRFIRDPFCVMDFSITLMDVVGAIIEIVLSGAEDAKEIIDTLNLLRLARMVRMARLCKLLADVFRRKRSGLVEERSKRVNEARGEFKKGNYLIQDPGKDSSEALMAQMTTVMRAYHLAKSRHFDANAWVSRKKGQEFGKRHAQPRRVKTFEGKYRKLLYGEDATGELYSIRHTGLREINEHFGLSIGLYFNTLYMCGVFFVLVFIASSPAVAGNAVITAKSEADLDLTIDPKLLGTAVCLAYTNVTTADGESRERMGCEPGTAHITAAFLVLLMLFYFYRSYKAYVESVIQEIDDKIISAQDFAVEVMDPDAGSARDHTLLYCTLHLLLYCTLHLLLYCTLHLLLYCTLHSLQTHSIPMSGTSSLGSTEK